jgi:hypothetical protein
VGGCCSTEPRLFEALYPSFVFAESSSIEAKIQEHLAPRPSSPVNSSCVSLAGVSVCRECE